MFQGQFAAVSAESTGLLPSFPTVDEGTTIRMRPKNSLNIGFSEKSLQQTRRLSAKV